MGKIYTTGNTVIDAVIQHLSMAEKKSEILETISFRAFALATAHRAENVDAPTVLKKHHGNFCRSPNVSDLRPASTNEKETQAEQNFQQNQKSENIQILSPLSYLDFLVLMKTCRMIVIDSGGI